MKDASFYVRITKDNEKVNVAMKGEKDSKTGSWFNWN